jgi:hypothetical protein
MKELFDTQSAITCHANLSETTDKIQQCLSDDEKKQTHTVADLFQLKNDIINLQTLIRNALTSGQSIFDNASDTTIISQLKTRKSDLNTTFDKLKKETQDKQSTIDKLNRDFLDSNKNVNESKVLFLEDYTMFFVLISYLFMIFIFIFVYTYTSNNKLYTFATTIGASVTFTVAGGLLLYNII